MRSASLSPNRLLALTSVGEVGSRVLGLAWCWHHSRCSVVSDLAFHIFVNG